MINFFRNYVPVIGIGLFTAAAWSFGFSKLHYMVYQALGSPENPTRLLWLFFILQSFLMGAIPGIFVPIISKQSTKMINFVFLVIISMFVFSLSLLFGGVQAIFELLGSLGFWVFLSGALFGSLSAGYAKRAT